MLIDQIKKDLIEYQKQVKAEEVSALRLLIAGLINAKKEKMNQDLTDEEVLKVVKSEVKKRKDSIESYRKGGREELAQKEEKELNVLGKYLPEELSREEIKEIVQKVILEKEISDIKSIGILMKEVISRTNGLADGRVINQIAKELLK